MTEQVTETIKFLARLMNLDVEGTIDKDVQFPRECADNGTVRFGPIVPSVYNDGNGMTFHGTQGSTHRRRRWNID